MTLLRHAIRAVSVVAILAPCALAQKVSSSTTSPQQSINSLLGQAARLGPPKVDLPNPSPQQSIESLLASGDPRLVAWGAHNALVANRRDLIPDLLSLAAQWRPIVRKNPDAWNAADDLPQEDLVRRDAMQAVLDTLIQMNVPVPADVLLSLAPEFGNDVAVLLSRMPQEQAIPLALDFYHSTAERGSLGFVSTAMLALHPQPGFAADMLRSTDVYAFIMVVQPGKMLGGAHGGPDCFAGGFGAPKQDWPLIGQYLVRGGQPPVEAKARGSAIPLVGGIEPTYAIREEARHYRAGSCGTGVDLGREDRRRLIAEMLGVGPEELPWQTEVSMNLEFHSPEQLNASIRRFIAEQQAKYRLTVAALLQRNLITPSEARTALPHLLLKIHDDRHDENAAAISKPADLPANVKWLP